MEHRQAHWKVRRGAWSLACVCALAAGPSLARQTGGEGAPPAPSDAEKRLLPPPVLRPAAADGARASGASADAERADLLREGSFLRARRGRLVRQDAWWVFVFDADAEGRAEPPMRLLPCRRLREMQQSMAMRAGTPTFEATGQVFVYAGVNYLLPTFFSVAAVAANDAAQPAGSVAAKEADPDARDLLGEMMPRNGLGARSGRRGVVRGAGVESAAPLREGVMLVSRRGRIVRDESGHLVFVMDNDAGEAGRSDTPMALMPCLNLELIERIAGRRGPQAVFRMSGRVFAYEGRNYLLPTFFVVEPGGDGNIVPAQ